MKKQFDISRLQGALLEAFGKLSAKEVDGLKKAVTSGAIEKGFTYERSGVIESINLMLVPSFCTGEQEAFLKQVSLAIRRGVESIYNAWFHDRALQALLPFNDDEKGWLMDCHIKAKGASEPMWYRLDAHFHMKQPDWKSAVRIFEINSSAVGGIHYAPIAEELFLELVMPNLQPHLPGLPPLKKTLDSREMLLGLLTRHAMSIGRKSLNIAFAEDTTADEGITEGPHIVEFLRSRGVNIRLSDPRDLHIKGGGLCDRAGEIDIVYRNFELRDAMDWEKEGFNMRALRSAFLNKQAVSTLCGEFDHKSMWEALASGSFNMYLNNDDIAVFKRHLLWTRGVRERRTIGPDGGNVDLLPFAIKGKDMLVLKPNRLCGGHGVAIGLGTLESEWEAMLDKALKEDGEWVLQSYSPPEKYSFPLFERGRLVFEEHNIVYGLTATEDGAGVLGRVSTEPVVNIARHGGLMPVLRAG